MKTSRTKFFDPARAWPRVREHGDEAMVVRGRCLSPLRFVVVRRVLFIAVTVVAWWLMFAALLPSTLAYNEDFGRGLPVGWLIAATLDFRMGLRWFFTELFPALGSGIYYTGTSLIDWHMLVLFVLTYRLRTAISFFLTHLVAVLLWPLASHGFRVTVDADEVTFGLPWWRHRLDRAHDVKFRTVGPDTYGGLVGLLLRSRLLKDNYEGQYPRVVALSGRRPFLIASPRRNADAQAIVESLQLALERTQTL